MEKIRQIVLFKDYFLDFYKPLDKKLKDKIDQVLFLVTIAEKIPRKFFKAIAGTNGLYEIRVSYQGNIYRIFCCFDKGSLVVVFHGFQKKKQKTPATEIGKALRIMAEYFEIKRNAK